MLSDYYDRPYFGPVADATGTSEDFDVYVPASDNNFINGRPSYAYNGSLTGTHSSACDPSEIDTGLETFRFKSGKSDRLRLINSGAAAFQYFSIDEHVLEVIAVDFTPIKPYNTTVLPLGIGQRANVLIHGSQAPDAAYWMRATVGTNCSRGSVNETKAMVYYDQAPQDARPTSQPYYIPNTWCTDVSSLRLDQRRPRKHSAKPHRYRSTKQSPSTRSCVSSKCRVVFSKPVGIGRPTARGMW